MDSDTIATPQEQDDTASQTSVTTSEPEIQKNNEPADVDFGIKSALNGMPVPSTERKRNHNADSVTTGLTENMSASTANGNAHANAEKTKRETMKVVLPQDKTLSILAGDYGMNTMELQELNPQIKDWRRVRPGDTLFVYKMKK